MPGRRRAARNQGSPAHVSPPSGGLVVKELTGGSGLYGQGRRGGLALTFDTTLTPKLAKMAKRTGCSWPVLAWTYGCSEHSR